MPCCVTASAMALIRDFLQRLSINRAAVGTEIPMGIPIDMGVGTVMNPHGPVGILWGFSNGCEIKRKRYKYAINHKCHSRCLNFTE